MAAYATTTTFDQPNPERISQNLGITSGKCDITNYNTTGAEITAITAKFKKVWRVICDGFTDNLYGCRWDTTDQCFHCFSGDTTADGPFNEEASDTDAGEVNFYVIGTL